MVVLLTIPFVATEAAASDPLSAHFSVVKPLSAQVVNAPALDRLLPATALPAIVPVPNSAAAPSDAAAIPTPPPAMIDVTDAARESVVEAARRASCNIPLYGGA